MSTGHDSVVTGGPKPYYCYQCERIVNLSPTPNDDLICPNCNGEFLEEQDEAATNPNPNSQTRSASSPNPSSFFSFSSPASSSSSEFFASGGGFPVYFGDDVNRHNNNDPHQHLNPADFFSSLLGGVTSGAGGGGGGGGGGGVGTRAGYVDPDQFDPAMFLHSYLNSMAGGGSRFQFVVDESLGSGANLGDYFFGHGLEELIQQLAENDPNRYGTPPASKKAVEKLPDVEVTNELLASDEAQCAVCMDTFELGAKATQMPCKHIFHSECILPWLELHNSCPVCRYELPTDDPDYEAGGRRGGGGNVNARAGGGVTVNLGASSAAGGTGGSNEGNSGTPTRSGGRSITIQLPFPFSFLGSGSAGSGSDGNNSSGGGNNDGGNSAGRSQE